MRSVATPLLVFSLLVLPHRATAFSAGFTGRSGKQGLTCSQCHSDGANPVVRFEGPRQVAAGAVATFHFIIESQAPRQTHAGFNVAASDGVLGANPGTGVQALADEVTHSRPQANDGNGVASFEFLWTAPSRLGTQTLWGAGNSVNRNFSDSGDGVVATTLTIEVVAPTTPTPSPSPTPPATCSGDCSGDGVVTIDELVLSVNVASLTTTEACRAVDRNLDSLVDISEIMGAVNSALGGCPP